MTELELMFDSLFISMADGRVMAGRDDSEKFMKRVVELEGENQRLRELLTKAYERLLDLEMHYTQLEDDIAAVLQEKE